MIDRVVRVMAATAITVLGFSSSVDAHDFVLRYDLPVPFALYLYACGATVVVTFMLFGWFVRMPAGQAAVASAAKARSADEPIGRLPAWLLEILRVLALGLLALAIVAGLVGTRNPDINVSLTLFWHVFLLGFTYLTAVIGDLYALVNPWRTISRWLERDTSKPRLAYPQALAYWPAFVFYVALIWIELFTQATPRMLGWILIVYTAITMAGAWLFGTATWLRYGDVFSVLMRIVATIAPIVYRSTRDEKSIHVHWRTPFSGTLEERADHVSLVAFVLFMLSSTTYDGIHQTVFWMGLFWNKLVVVLQPLWGTDLLASQRMLERWYGFYQRAGLVLSPFFYLAIYWGILALMKALTRTRIAVRTLALEFAFSIIPIAFVYHLAHYYTLLLTQSPKLPYLLSDPFGFGWNPFGLPQMGEAPTLDVAAVWHTEVALILIGHVVSVYLAHRIALRLFAARRHAVLSQLPMLALMVGYTVIGLWVISLPFALISKSM